jgi:hypothetical protein
MNQTKKTSILAQRIKIITHFTSAIIFASSVHAQPSNRLLGIPFGEKLRLTQCPSDTQKATKPCWIEKPFYDKPTGAKLGYAFLPNPDSRPKWAAYAMFSLTLDKANVVQEIKVNTFDPAERFEIAQSISSRFGKSDDDRLKSSDVKVAYWSTKEGTAQIRCSKECWVEFRTPTAQAERNAEYAARQKADAVRPKAP